METSREILKTVFDEKGIIKDGICQTEYLKLFIHFFIHGHDCDVTSYLLLISYLCFIVVILL